MGFEEGPCSSDFHTDQDYQDVNTEAIEEAWQRDNLTNGLLIQFLLLKSFSCWDYPLCFM